MKTTDLKELDPPVQDADSSARNILYNYYKLPFEYRCNYENSLILREQILYMKEKSIYRENSVLENIYMVDYDNFAEQIFLLCAEFNLSHECKYNAYELFKRFLCIHILQLIKALKTPEHERSEVDDYWAYINGKLKEQLLLRTLSCVQIASKMTNRNECISNETIHSFLNRTNTPFTIDAIAKSELRVFSTVGFRAVKDDSLFSNFECHMLVVEQNVEALNLDRLYDVALKVLDIVQIHWSVILKSFLACLEGIYGSQLTTDQQRLQLLNHYNNECLSNLEEANFKQLVKKYTKNNHFVISCGVIAAAVYLMEREFTERVVRALASHIDVGVEAVAIATTYIVMFVHNGA